MTLKRKEGCDAYIEKVAKRKQKLLTNKDLIEQLSRIVETEGFLSDIQWGKFCDQPVSSVSKIILVPPGIVYPGANTWIVAETGNILEKLPAAGFTVPGSIWAICEGIDEARTYFFGEASGSCCMNGRYCNKEVKQESCSMSLIEKGKELEARENSPPESSCLIKLEKVVTPCLALVSIAYGAGYTCNDSRLAGTAIEVFVRDVFLAGSTAQEVGKISGWLFNGLFTGGLGAKFFINFVYDVGPILCAPWEDHTLQKSKQTIKALRELKKNDSTDEIMSDYLVVSKNNNPNSISLFQEFLSMTNDDRLEYHGAEYHLVNIIKQLKGDPEAYAHYQRPSCGQIMGNVLKNGGRVILIGGGCFLGYVCFKMVFGSMQIVQSTLAEIGEWNGTHYLISINNGSGWYHCTEMDCIRQFDFAHYDYNDEQRQAIFQSNFLADLGNGLQGLAISYDTTARILNGFYYFYRLNSKSFRYAVGQSLLHPAKCLSELTGIVSMGALCYFYTENILNVLPAALAAQGILEGMGIAPLLAAQWALPIAATALAVTFFMAGRKTVSHVTEPIFRQSGRLIMAICMMVGLGKGKNALDDELQVRTANFLDDVSIKDVQLVNPDESLKEDIYTEMLPDEDEDETK
ncbi:hypothetical protein CI610_03219 [invertebrate metagenome]|uniref:Uncharacterized protein n=1 Tax=invertebrate metagenome TaxID=1711999 RepID=A0A2H9T3Q4_9ZZZZ